MSPARRVFFHIEERIDELVSAGRTRDEAEREVRRRFGSVERVEEECATIDRAGLRTRERGEWFDALRRDAVHAGRGLARRPAFTAIVVATLALGIGANAAMFGAVYSVLLRPIPLDALDRLVVIRNEVPSLPLVNAALAPAEWMDLAARTDLFDRQLLVESAILALLGGFAGLGVGYVTLRFRRLRQRVRRTAGSQHARHDPRLHLGRHVSRGGALRAAPGVPEHTDRCAGIVEGIWQKRDGLGIASTPSCAAA
jgi:hypothetical protein